MRQGKTAKQTKKNTKNKRWFLPLRSIAQLSMFFQLYNDRNLASERASTGAGKFAAAGVCCGLEKNAKLSKQTKKKNMWSAFLPLVRSPAHFSRLYIFVDFWTTEYSLLPQVNWAQKSPVKDQTIKNLPISSRATLIALCVCAIQKFARIYPSRWFCLETINFFA